MAINNLTNPGTFVQRDDVQQTVTALKGDVVPRNSSGTAAANAGALGTDIIPWSAAHVTKLFLNGEELVSGSEGGTGGSVAPGNTIQNGVVSGLAPAGRPGMCGWLHQAGSNGVVITATTADPLVVKLDGTAYSRESNITGGTLPAGFSQSLSPQTNSVGMSATGGGTWAAPSVRYAPATADRAKYRYATGGTFAYDSISGTETLPDSYGNNIIIKSTGGVAGTSYTYCQRVSSSSSPSGQRNLAKLKMGEAFNTSPTAQDYPAWQLPFHSTHHAIRCGSLFVDPLTATWNLTISARIVGAVNTTLPGTTGYSTGDMVFLESDQRWHRFSGAGWDQTSFVFLGFLAIDGGAVEAVMPVRTEASLAAMLDKKLAVLGDPVAREGQVDGDNIRFGGQRSDVEDKGFAELGGQQVNQIGTSAVVDTSDTALGSLSNDELFCVYLDVADNNYYFEATPPVYQIYRQRLLLIHPNRQRLYVGSFATADDGTLIAAQSISNRGNRLDEGSDDSFRISNPCLFGRSKLTDLGQPEDRRMQIQIRGRGTRSSGTNTLRYRWRGTRVWWPGPLLNKERWDELFFSYLTPHVLEEVEYDTDNDPDLIVEFSQWDEPSLLYATGLDAAAREGRARAAAGGSSDAGGAIATVDTPQLTDNSVGQNALSNNAVGIPQLDTNNVGVAGNVLSITADPDDSAILRLEWAASSGGGGGGGGSSFSVSGTKAAGKFIQATGTGTNDQSWVDLDFDDLTGIVASEAEIFDDPTANTAIVGNKTLFDAFTERDRQMDIFWGDWAVQPTVTRSTIAANGTLAVGNFNILMRNTGTFNVGTTALTDSLYLVGTACAGLPTLSSGVLRGGLLWIDSEDRRVFQPIDNPESGDDEEYYLYLNGAWSPRAWNADFLNSHIRGLLDDDKWNGIAAHAAGGPSANVFNDEAAIAKRDSNIITMLRCVYSTSDNEFRVVTATQRLEVPIAPGQIMTDMIADGAIDQHKLGQDSVGGPALRPDAVANGNILMRTITGNRLVMGTISHLELGGTGQAANRYLRLNSGANALVWDDGPGTSSYNKDTLWSSNTGITSTTTTQTLASGKSFANWDFVRFEFTDGGTTYYSPLFEMSNDVRGNSDQLVDVRNGVNISVLSTSTWKLETFSGTGGVTRVVGSRYS